MYIRLASVISLLVPFLCPAQIVKLAELNTDQVKSLDRTHTVILLTDGIMEEHGPYMPSYTDGYLHEAVSADLARAVVAQPGWTVAMFPVIPLGTNAANGIGHKYSFPSSYTVSEQTMRSIYMDLADDFGALGFRYVFIVDGHGGPTNNLALDLASDYFRDTYHGTMTHLMGTMRVIACCDAFVTELPKEQQAENGLEVHAGILEQSQVFFFRPDLVPEAVRNARSNGAADFAGLEREAMKPEWPGYLGAPRYASASLGARYYKAISAAVNALALEILSGKVNPYALERYSTVMMEPTKAIEAPLRTHEAKMQQQHEDWLKAHSAAIP